MRRGLHNWDEDGTLELSQYFDRGSPYTVIEGRKRRQGGACHCVGGASVFYVRAPYLQVIAIEAVLLAVIYFAPSMLRRLTREARA